MVLLFRYRRILFIGILPLLSADTSRKAALGVFFSLCSMTFFREMEPFHRRTNSVLAFVAQYGVFLTFSAALVIDTSLGDGLNQLLFGGILVLVNITVFALAVVLSAQRYHADMLRAKRKREKYANKLENAIGFSSNKFYTTLQSISRNAIPPSQCLMFCYSSAENSKLAMASGLPIFAHTDGILFTMHLPGELDANDKFLFPVREVMLICSIPRALLLKLNEYEQAALADVLPNPERTEHLRFLSTKVLRALRPSYFGDIPVPSPWFEGQIRLPPSLIVRAYLIVNLKAKTDPAAEIEPYAVDDVSVEPNSRQGRSRTTSEVTNASSTISFLRKPHTPSSAQNYVGEMNIIRRVCEANGWVPVYHYTQPSFGDLILKSGFRMSTQGQGDGGVYFSTLGPASYHIGEDDYEESLIVDCYGETRVHEYMGKGNLDLVLVYGAEPSILSLAPGGRMNAVVVSKPFFEAFSLPHADTNYFLRGDRILGAFILDASSPPLEFQDSVDVLRNERLYDSRTKERIGDLFNKALVNEKELREKMRVMFNNGSNGSRLSESHEIDESSLWTSKSHLQDNSEVGVEMYNSNPMRSPVGMDV